MIRSTIASLRDALRRWMVCYALLGLVQSGMVPIILPLSARPGPAAGLTYAAFAASGIAAPFVGAWSDKHRKHRRTLAFGLALAGLALLADMLAGGMVQHMAAAALVGLGVSSAYFGESDRPFRPDRDRRFRTIVTGAAGDEMR